MPIKEMISAMLAIVESGSGPVYRSLIIPASLIACRQAFHQSHGLSVRINIGIHLGRARSQPASNGSVLDGVCQFLAATHRPHDEPDADEPKSLDKNSSVDV